MADSLQDRLTGHLAALRADRSVGGAHLRFQRSALGGRADLTGHYGIGRTREWDPITVERQLAEQLGVMVNAVLRRHAPLIKDRVIRERLSAPWVRGGRTGRILQVNPLSLGLRRRSGKLQKSVRTTVTSPGTNARGFRGVFRISSKVGGGPVQYAHRHENTGRMQFQRVTLEEYARIQGRIRANAAQIASRFGGTVR